MSFSDPIADMLSRVRNAQAQRLAVTQVPFSRLRENVLKVLLTEGYISGYQVVPVDEIKSILKVDLKYVDGKATIRKILRVSTPGRRVYSSSKKIPKFFNGLGCTILTTSKGIMTDFEAKKLNVGGEVLCKVF